ncbi:inner membrane protein [Escherichia coli]|uniref:Inner membrane protein n=1 Tax=Escherichia coli TaxID=562 RepID=A0A376KZG0_ECOLX|nr:inner membrane protein [Escherichia coli]
MLPVLYRMLKRSHVKPSFFAKQTGIAPFIVILPDINNEASLRQNGKAMLAHASSSLSNVKGSVLLLFTTREPRLIMITNGQVESGLDDKHLGLLIENHTLAYLNADLWYQGINNALAVLQAQILKQPTPATDVFIRIQDNSMKMLPPAAPTH